jgi:ribosome modulation factor
MGFMMGGIIAKVALLIHKRRYATKEGYLARLTGVSVDNNPYSNTTANGRDWDLAWRYADRLVANAQIDSHINMR